MALVLAGCTSGGGKQATPAAAKASTTLAAPKFSSVAGKECINKTASNQLRPSCARVKVGSCPAKYPAQALKAVNANVRRLDTRLVPIVASKVRICGYDGHFAYSKGVATSESPGPLDSHVFLSGNAAATFARDTNGLPTGLAGPPPCPGIAPGQPLVEPNYFVFTFANDDASVEVRYDDGVCAADQLFNGDLLGDPTAQWLTDLQAFDPTEGTTTPLLPLRHA